MRWFPQKVQPIRSPDPRLEPTLGDIESHMPAGHPYRDSRHVTWAHETTHGLNARIRNQNVKVKQIAVGAGLGLTLSYPVPVDGVPFPELRLGRVNACYVLGGKAFVCEEPDLRLSQIAEAVPRSMRGMSYRLYLVEQQRYWEDCPLYVFDEWSAYANGLSTAIDANGGDGAFSDVLQMLEFTAYALVLANKVTLLNKEGENFYGFLKWMIERCVKLYLQSKKIRELHNNSQVEYEHKILTAPDFDDYREMTTFLYGAGWLQSLFNGDLPGPEPEPGPKPPDPEPEPDDPDIVW